MEVDKMAIDLIEKFGVDVHFRVAKMSAIICIDEILYVLNTRRFADQNNKSILNTTFWHRVKLKVYQMKIVEYYNLKHYFDKIYDDEKE